ncbi:MAG: low molecular weight phosphatase family protein [Rhodobacteraceae bacterium]|nr:low molecular weight phosphatase family protein [Paracoccaceae bacterium]
MVSRPSSVLFACDHNAVRSPMAEGMMKRDYGTSIFVQSAGVRHDIEVDGFSVAVCEEVGVTLGKHRARSFAEMEEWGDQIDGYDLIVALSPAAQRAALEYTRYYALEVEYWPIMDPTDLGRTRAEKLVSYRQARDQIAAKIRARFGPPLEADE